MTNNQTGRLPPQSLLQQRYIIIEQIGRGGMGAVYAATDTRIAHRRVAIKEMSQARFSPQELAEATTRFQQEAAMLGALSHPNLPRIYDAFSEQGRSYLVMDLIEGKTLHQLLKEAHGQPLAVVQVLLYARQLCDVLSYLHQRTPPIIFRDIKPTNIMIVPTGQIYLIDFGIARFFKEGQQQDTILLGSPGYAPPEQHGIAQTSPRSDIYGLGATLHHCLTGRDPSRASDSFSFPPIRRFNPQVPSELDKLIQRMVAHDDQERPANALEVQQALMQISQQAAEHTSQFQANSLQFAPTQYIPPQPGPLSGQSSASNAPTNPIVPQQPSLSISTSTASASPALTKAMPTSHSPWSSGFLALFLLLSLLIVGGCIYTFNFICASAHIVEAGLSILLVLSIIGAGVIAKSRLTRGIMFISGLAALATGYAFTMLAQPDLAVIKFTDPSALCTVNSLPDEQFLTLLSTVGLGIVGLASLYWLTRSLSQASWIILCILFGGAILCTLARVFIPDEVAGHILLLIALIMLIQGNLISAKLEQSQRKGLLLALKP
ncbi:serine/threonine-protein kinase [Ktedonosporobacter rubrisoli]|nr:serine/threonine-protein kinase [Ktedonosporobacter rubrisoli]